MDNLQFGLHVFQKTRQTVVDAVANLTAEQLLAMPASFDNNILWNVGHIIVIQQALVYGRSGLDPLIDLEAMQANFWPRTSPADWKTTPDVTAVLAMLSDHSNQFAADIAAGKFTDVAYQPRTSGSGIYVETVAEVVHYNNYHEGLHLGAILALRNLVAD
ncbi:MAG: DinB family protein [Chloroflexota bacterium]